MLNSIQILIYIKVKPGKKKKGSQILKITHLNKIFRYRKVVIQNEILQIKILVLTIIRI